MACEIESVRVIPSSADGTRCAIKVRFFTHSDLREPEGSYTSDGGACFPRPGAIGRDVGGHLPVRFLWLGETDDRYGNQYAAGTRT